MAPLIFRILFNPVFNRIYSRTLRPFDNVLPLKLQIPVGGVFKLKLNAGQDLFIEGHYTSYITRRLFWEGIRGFEYDSVKIFMDLAKNARLILDIGANFGYYSLIASKVNPNAEIIAFEPFPDAMEALKRNIRRNGFTHIKAEPSGLSDHEDEVELFYRLNPDFPGKLQLAGDNTLAGGGDERNQSVVIKTFRLDDYMDRNKPGKIDLIKIDTETLEYRIFSGGIKTLERDRPVILTEVIPGHHELEIQEMFTKLDYRFYSIEPGGIRKRGNLTSLDENTNYLLIPKEKEGEIESFVKEEIF